MATRQQLDKQMRHWAELSHRLHEFRTNPSDEKTRLLLEAMAQYRQDSDAGSIGIQATGVSDGTQVQPQHAQNYPAINAYDWHRGHSG